MRLAGLALLPLVVLLSCGKADKTPSTAQGAWSVNFVAPDANCAVDAHDAQMGDVTANTKTEVLADGADGANITCSVVGTQSFEVSAMAIQGNNLLQLTIDAITADATAANPATGTVVFSDATTVATYLTLPDSPCNFYFEPDTDEGVASGTIWVSFTCAAISADTSTCGIQQGYAILENCSS